jgi:xylitol oxidase
MRNWAGNVDYSSADLRTPATVEELQELVSTSPRVRATGTRHSFSGVVDTSGVLVSTTRLGRTVEIDEARELAWVPAAATYAQVAPVLEGAGWALHNMASLPHISVAGACATGTHGSGVGNGCLASRVVGVEAVAGTGELVTGGAGDPDFGGLVLSLGSWGVTTRLAVAVEPSYTVGQEVVLDVPLTSVAREIQSILAAAYSVSLFLSFRDPAVVDSMWFKQRGTDGVPLEGLWGGRRADIQVHPIVGLDPHAATNQLGSSGPWFERLPHFKPSFTPSAGDELQSEFFVPRDAASEVLPALSGRSGEFAAALRTMEIRTIASDEMWLSPFQGRETLAVHATWTSDFDSVRPALQRLEDVLRPFEPRPHWGKVFLDFDKDWVASTYPETPKYRELAERLDPERRFVNTFVEDLGIR